MTAQFNPLLVLLCSYNKALALLDKQLQDAGWLVQHSHIFIVLLLQSGITRQTKLAEFLGITRQAVCETMRAMHDSGLIETEPDRRDLRAKIIKLTPLGAELSQLVQNSMADVETVLNVPI